MTHAGVSRCILLVYWTVKSPGRDLSYVHLISKLTAGRDRPHALAVMILALEGASPKAFNHVVPSSRFQRLKAPAIITDTRTNAFKLSWTRPAEVYSLGSAGT